MASRKKKDIENDRYVFQSFWSAGNRVVGMAGKLSERLDPFSKHGEQRRYVSGYEQAMLAAACDVLENQGYVFRSTLREHQHLNIFNDFIHAINSTASKGKEEQ